MNEEEKKDKKKEASSATQSAHRAGCWSRAPTSLNVTDRGMPTRDTKATRSALAGGSVDCCADRNSSRGCSALVT